MLVQGVRHGINSLNNSVSLIVKPGRGLEDEAEANSSGIVGIFLLLFY